VIRLVPAAGLLGCLFGGCSQILGLEDTKFEHRDAMIDAPSNCDGAPRCTSSTGRSVCGQLYGAGASAGLLLRADSPTGETCATLASTTGPCAYAVYAQPLAGYYAGTTDDHIMGELDDCGRFVVPDLDSSAADVAVVFSGGEIVESVTLVLGREAMAGIDVVKAPLIPTAALTDWAMQIDPASPPTLSGGYLVTYVNALGESISMQELRVNGGAVGDPPTTPWGAYFTGTGAYGTIDGAATTTSASGSALVVPATSMFNLGGFRPGKNCAPAAVQPHPNAFIHLALSC
jgi:hypothetical protein